MERLLTLEVWLMLIAAPCVISFVLGEVRGWNRAKHLFSDCSREPKREAPEMLGALEAHFATPRLGAIRATRHRLPAPIFARGSATSESLQPDMSREDATEMLRNYRRAILALRAQMPRLEETTLTLYPAEGEDWLSGPRIADIAPLSPDMRASHFATPNFASQRRASEPFSEETIPNLPTGPVL